MSLMHIAGVGTALPPHRYDQEALLAAFRELWAQQHHNGARVEQLHRAVCVGARHLALPMERYRDLDFEAANDAFIDIGTTLAQEALSRALVDAELTPLDLDALFFTTVTGVATPSLDARLVNRMGLRGDVRRSPFFGLGCVGGAAGAARMADYLRGAPGHTAALVSVELCSLTLQRDDLSVPNLIASGLFGDGAAAVIGVGAARARTLAPRGPAVTATASRLYPDSEGVMGWDVGGSGLRVVLSAAVPEVVRANLRDDVDSFLARHGLARADIAAWLSHCGGPKVLDAVAEALELPPDALAASWRSLREVGNLSSASVLFVLADVLAGAAPPPGAHGLLMAMGPGFCSELLLLRW